DGPFVEPLIDRWIVVWGRGVDHIHHGVRQLPVACRATHVAHQGIMIDLVAEPHFKARCQRQRVVRRRRLGVGSLAGTVLGIRALGRGLLLVGRRRFRWARFLFARRVGLGQEQTILGGEGYGILTGRRGHPARLGRLFLGRLGLLWLSLFWIR